MKIPVALHNSVPRGGWEFAFAGLEGGGGGGKQVQIWSLWQLCADPQRVPDVIPRRKHGDS